MNQVEEYILNAEPRKKDILLYFHLLLTEEYQLRAAIKYKVPMYKGKRMVAYLNPIKRNEVELCFINAHLMDKPHGLLESKGRKMVKSIEFKTLEEIPEEAIRQIINDAMQIDESFRKVK